MQTISSRTHADPHTGASVACAPVSAWATLACLLLATAAVGQDGPAVQAAELRAAVDRLGDLDYETRMNAARTVRRAAPSMAVPMLLQAVAGHEDGFVRYRALVLASGFNDPRTRDTMRAALADPNDRLRTVAYGYFEHFPDPSILPALLRAVEREESEFVRPARMRALAAHGSDARVRETLIVEVGRGVDFFRSTVIEALGLHRAEYALDPLIAIAGQDGPLRDDAVLALGRIGNKRAIERLASLQRSAPSASQPRLAAAICLLGINCPAHLRYVTEALDYGIRQIGFQPLLRSAAAGLAAVAESGHAGALGTLVAAGIPARDPARAPLALAVGAVALRNTPLMLEFLEQHQQLPDAIELLRDAFDMLEEDFEEERFFATVRRTYWQAEEGSPRRRVAEALIVHLEF
jgi:hypothetical protein